MSEAFWPVLRRINSVETGFLRNGKLLFAFCVSGARALPLWWAKLDGSVASLVPAGLFPVEPVLIGGGGGFERDSALSGRDGGVDAASDPTYWPF